MPELSETPATTYGQIAPGRFGFLIVSMPPRLRFTFALTIQNFPALSPN
jgi:hypothetical protein